MADRPSHPGLPAYPGLVIEAAETVWDGRFPLQRVRFRHTRFDGAQSGPRTWELWRRGRAAAMLPYDPVTDQVVLIEQFRLPALAAGLDPIMLEVPAGLCDAGEDAEATIRREMQEETGLEPTDMVPIGDYLLTPGGADERCMLFAGRVSAPVGPGRFGLATEGEDIRLVLRPALVAIEDALAGRTPNSVLAIALLWLAARREWLRHEWGVA